MLELHRLLWSIRHIVLWEKFISVIFILREHELLFGRLSRDNLSYVGSRARLVETLVHGSCVSFEDLISVKLNFHLLCRPLAQNDRLPVYRPLFLHRVF